MSAVGRMRGHRVVFDEIDQVWRYADTGEPTAEYGGSDRSCITCGRPAEPCSQEGCDGKPHDPCLGHIDGCRGACCGHGAENGYVIMAPLSALDVWPEEPS